MCHFWASGLDLWVALRMEAVCFFETLVFTYKSELRFNRNTTIGSKPRIFRFGRLTSLPMYLSYRTQMVVAGVYRSCNYCLLGQTTLNVDCFIFWQTLQLPPTGLMSSGGLLNVFVVLVCQ